MDFDTWLAQAWDAHAADAAATAARLHEGLALVDSDARLSRLAHLAHHLHGEHLAQWDAGRAWLSALRTHPHATPDGAAAGVLPVYLASLALSANSANNADDAAAADVSALPPSARIRATAMAAANLALHDTPRALALFNQALQLADATALPAADPATRALAVTANNLAATLEEQPSRSADERALMILAAQTARRCWAVAGGWLETERAEYRLAMTWLQAGDAAQALQHARACLAVVDANGAPALERFFGCEAVALAAHAGGASGDCDQAVDRPINPAGDRAINQAASAYAALPADDQAWCRPTMDKLRALLLSAPQPAGAASPSAPPLPASPG